MNNVAQTAKEYTAQGKKIRIACPMFGAGLAGGDWNTIEAMIKNTWGDVDTTVYYLPQFLPPGWSPPNADN